MSPLVNIVHSTNNVPANIFQFVHAKQTEEYLRGKNLFDVTVLNGAYQILAEELQPDTHLLDASPEYRKQVALGVFYKSVLRIAPSGVTIDAKLQSGATLLQRPLSTGQQAFTSDEKVSGCRLDQSRICISSRECAI